MNTHYWPSTQPQYGNAVAQNNLNHWHTPMPIYSGQSYHPPADTWQSEHNPYSDYPMGTLPGRLGEMAKTLYASGIDPAIVDATLRAIAALLTGPNFDVKWPNDVDAHVGSNEMVIGGTCSGKSFVMKRATARITAMLESLPESDALANTSLFIEDSNRIDILKHLEVCPIGMLCTDEGALVTQLFQTAGATITKLLDGHPIRFARTASGRIEVPTAHFYALIEMQPEIFQAKQSAFGVGPGSVGTINRFTLTRSTLPANLERLHRFQPSNSATERYERRVEQLFCSLLDQLKTKRKRPAVRLSPEAKEFLIYSGNEIQRSMGPNAIGHDISHYLKRHAERVLKQAGVFHTFEHGVDGEVEIATVVSADILGRWSCKCFHELTFQPRALSQSEFDVIKLESELMTMAAQTGLIEFRLKEVRRYAPNIGLTTARFSRALATLAGSGKFQIRRIDRTDWLQIPALASGSSQQYVPRLID